MWAMTSDPFHPAPYLADGAHLFRTLLADGSATVTGAVVRQVQYRPGRSITLLYEVGLADAGDTTRTAPDTSGAGPETRTALEPIRTERVVVRCARTALAGLSPVAEDREGHPITMFRAVDDPGLPALRSALDPAMVGQLFADLGLGRAGDPVSLRFRAHRPLRRAVVEATGRHGRLFLKLVPPAEITGLHRRHRLLGEAGVAVAPSVGWTEDGIVVLGAVPGSTLRETLGTGGASPAVGDVHRLLDGFPGAIAELPGPLDPVCRVAEHTEMLAAVAPSLALKLARLNDGIADVAAAHSASRDEPVEPVHGDLHEAQLMVAGGRLLGVVDVDGAGSGHRIDDDANLLGHLSVLDLVVGHDHARSLGRLWLSDLDRSGRHDPAELRVRVAAVVAGLATGSYRVQETDWLRRTEHRLDLAASWLDSARRAGRRAGGTDPDRHDHVAAA